MQKLRVIRATWEEKKRRAEEERFLENSQRAPTFMGQVITQATDQRLRRAAATSYGATSFSRFKTAEAGLG